MKAYINSIIGANIDHDEFRAGWRAGVKTILPTSPAMLIWAVVTAVAMVAAGLPWYYVLLANVVVYAASAQLAVLTMLIAQAPLPIIWLAAAVVNLRFVIFSANLQLYFRHLRLPQRLLYGFLNTDIGSMLFAARYRNSSFQAATAEQTGFYFGINCINWLNWQIGCVAGVVFASQVPVAWGLDLAAALTLLVLIIKGVEHWAGAAGCAVAAVSAVWLQFLPYKLWVLVAIVAGVVVALWVEMMTKRRAHEPV